MGWKSTRLKSGENVLDRHPFDEALEKKAVSLLEQIRPLHIELDRFIRAITQRPAGANQLIHPVLPPHAVPNGLIPDLPPPAVADQVILDLVPSSPDEALTEFIASIAVLLSFSNQGIITATISMLTGCTDSCSQSFVLKLIRAGLIPHIVASLNPQSLSFADSKFIHMNLILTINCSVRQSILSITNSLGIEDPIEAQAVHDTILQQVLVPSEDYIRHICVNRHSMIEADQSYELLILLNGIVRICPYNPQTIDFVLTMPLLQAITSALTFCYNDESRRVFLCRTETSQREWSRQSRNVRQSAQIVLRCLRTEGFDDWCEQILGNEGDATWRRNLTNHMNNVSVSPGINLPERE
ncbi:hypothetical protein BLNAU_4245 [Blattamonas nauphoetae]|uniref:Uncharacterized protein n=1 Tax=Blattamonas nauphoetae TaxID=2049346 RepID=A0ABQ9YAY7_9EUKA|nr:hypothetical protein BLNAU_4245 [Blattamonas nauphoetae]